jgi:DNA-directed RNA polymerase II subunit RPB1
MSVCEVLHPVTYDGGKPKPSGLADLRMGSSSKEFVCTTCEIDGPECPGHFGHIELSKPMFHVAFMEKLVKVLRSVCLSCHKLKTDRVLYYILSFVFDLAIC